MQGKGRSPQPLPLLCRQRPMLPAMHCYDPLLLPLIPLTAACNACRS